MKVDRVLTDGELNSTGEISVPRQAATIILLRGGVQTLEVLLVQRHPDARFMPGTWVFPGGAVDAADGEGDDAHRLAAVRELEEEANVAGLDPGSLVKFSRWITPTAIAMRFDTHFFLGTLPAGEQARADGTEIVDLGWFTPAAALSAHGEGEIVMPFPTIKHLEQIGAYADVHTLLVAARNQEVTAVQPHVVIRENGERVALLPGDPGYEDR